MKNVLTRLSNYMVLFEFDEVENKVFYNHEEIAFLNEKEELIFNNKKYYSKDNNEIENLMIILSTNDELFLDYLESFFGYGYVTVSMFMTEVYSKIDLMDLLQNIHMIEYLEEEKEEIYKKLGEHVELIYYNGFEYKEFDDKAIEQLQRNIHKELVEYVNDKCINK